MTDPQIVVVDDDLEDHLILVDYFRELGNDQYVKFLQNGQQAIEYLSALSPGHLPRLIVLDLNMPILNGTQTLLYIKREQRFRDIPIIIFSTSENENEKRKCLSMGAVEYLVKPVTYDEGFRMVEKFNTYIERAV
jgi:CheY-like chemotaxis protein